MNPSVRAYRATHDPEHALTPALDALHHHGQSRRDEAVKDPNALRELAATVHLPVAAVRAALSSYSEVGHDPQAIRYCAGTSCALCGGDAIAESFRRIGPARPVYCLGYCDEAPAAMLPNGDVVAGLTPERCAGACRGEQPVAIPHTSIRSIARESIVTRRLLALPTKRFPEYAGLKAALSMTPEAVTDAVITANLRGRGGAAFPTGKKWLFAAKAKGSPKFIVANGDEGDPGSFIDRVLMESDPHGILEGMAIAAHAVGASRGVIFIRDEYPAAVTAMRLAIASANVNGRLGANALGPGRDFHVEVVRGLGSYVCGEETALLNAIEAGRGEVRPRPPFPVEEGLYGKPTVVVNVETLVNVPWIIERGAAAFRLLGTLESPGTKAICLNRGFANPGIVEVEFGLTLRDLIERTQCGGGGAQGQRLEAVLLGGPMGSIVTPDLWETPVCFSAMAAKKINLGHAGLVAIPAPANWAAILRHLLDFMRDESCGKCVPCRLGTTRGHELVHAGLSTDSAATLRRILDLMGEASLCAFGRETTGPVRTILDRFGPQVIASLGHASAKEVRR
ncbi:MAG: NAD(P)H-dependent oxidoreductase subunit E [Phycisphaerae bacterium]|jgi:NADH:ubiquinone oxidoreductase subunit F (NADH-binding)/NADH:ubiquinone oxidoreductase subunit E|nr:NAD(P)H-dependent oxidoreductase subunit E [Phycisphaerae bacterium]